MQQWLFALVLIFAIAGRSEAAVLEFKPLGVEVKSRDRILIKGFDGDVKLVASKGNMLTAKIKQETPEPMAPELRSSLDEWNISLQRSDQGVDVIVQSPHTKEVWRKVIASGGAPKFHLEISAPPVPLDMAWRNGKVVIENWAANVRVGMQDGSSQVIGGQGDLKITGHDLEIRVKNRSGKVAVESYSGKVTIESCKGSIEVENFNGETLLAQNEGHQEFHGFKTPLVVNGGRGKVEFETVRGPIKIANFQGNLKGTSDEAPVTAKISQSDEVRITTQSGAVTLDLPGSAASLSVASVEGGISGPSYLRSEQLAGQRVMRGRLRGSADGSVVIRTQSGPIRVR